MWHSSPCNTCRALPSCSISPYKLALQYYVAERYYGVVSDSLQLADAHSASCHVKCLYDHKTEVCGDLMTHILITSLTLCYLTIVMLWIRAIFNYVVRPSIVRVLCWTVETRGIWGHGPPEKFTVSETVSGGF